MKFASSYDEISNLWLFLTYLNVDHEVMRGLTFLGVLA